MFKLMRITIIIVAALIIFPKGVLAQKQAGTNTSQANLRIQVTVVPMVMTMQNPNQNADAAVSYSIQTAPPRMTVTKETQQMRINQRAQETKVVQITTVVAE
jgi:hypothetical protein